MVNKTWINPEITTGLFQKKDDTYMIRVIDSEGMYRADSMLDTFDCPPLCVDEDGDGAPTGTTWDENLIYTRTGFYRYHMLGTQTLVKPTWDANGLDIGLDQTDNDWVELTNGITSRSPTYFDVDDDNCYFKVTFTAEDVSWFDNLVVGFRKAEAYQADWNDYADLAAFYWDGTDLKTSSITASAATDSVDSTLALADATEVTLEVRVISNTVTFLKDDTLLSTYVSKSFNADDRIIPFFYLLHGTDVGGYCRLARRECGKLITR